MSVGKSFDLSIVKVFFIVDLVDENPFGGNNRSIAQFRWAIFLTATIFKDIPPRQ